MAVTYKLLERITEQSKLDAFNFPKNRRVTAVLEVNSDYNIICSSNRDYIYYEHIKGEDLVKICIYERMK